MISQWKIPVTPSVIEPATFRLVAPCRQSVQLRNVIGRTCSIFQPNSSPPPLTKQLAVSSHRTCVDRHILVTICTGSWAVTPRTCCPEHCASVPFVDMIHCASTVATTSVKTLLSVSAFKDMWRLLCCVRWPWYYSLFVVLIPLCGVVRVLLSVIDQIFA
jgi:hypothetical protein